MNLANIFKEGLANKIVETEKERYINFFTISYKENLSHCKFVLSHFPRWSIISGYYAMHNITKLFLAQNFGIKIDSKVHKTTIKILEIINQDKELLTMLKSGYEEFISMANDLSEAHEERRKAQYYTGSTFMNEKYKEKAESFLANIVLPYLNKITLLLKK